MTDYSIAHERNLDRLLRSFHPDGKVPWDEAVAPDVTSGDEKRMTGRLRTCAYCGSMHPADVAAAIKAGAHGSWADWKYGWPHKAYFDGVPNPHAGMLEVRGISNRPLEGWVQVGENKWQQPARPADATVMWKFYTVHLQDATPEERDVIERHLGLHFVFLDDGAIRWQSYEPEGN